jgi:hypothetical protein
MSIEQQVRGSAWIWLSCEAVEQGELCMGLSDADVAAPCSRQQLRRNVVKVVVSVASSCSSLPVLRHHLFCLVQAARPTAVGRSCASFRCTACRLQERWQRNSVESVARLQALLIPLLTALLYGLLPACRSAKQHSELLSWQRVMSAAERGSAALGVMMPCLQVPLTRVFVRTSACLRRSGWQRNFRCCGQLANSYDCLPR